jgi:hypothetical protein
VEQPEVKETENPDLEPGAREVKQELGGPGFTVTYTRRVLVDGDEKRDESYEWTYDPQDAYIEVGPEEEEEEPDRPRRDRGGTTTTEPDRTTTTAPRDDPEPPPAREPAPRTPAPGGAAPPPPS